MNGVNRINKVKTEKTMDCGQVTIRAQKGDSSAFAELYESTYKNMYYLALKFMKNETEAEDVLQDAYIKAWNHIETLKDPGNFQGWLSCIVSNTAKNALAKKNPLLFSQLEAEDEDGDAFVFDPADTSIENQPELNYTQKETQMLVREMIEGLTDEQRLCVLMFYFEQNSISEIAETLEVSENTVKSRLNYGRRNLKKKADDLQKKGYRFLGIAPVLLLLLLLRKEEVSAAVLRDAASAMDAGYKSIKMLKDTAGAAAKTAGSSAAEAGTKTAAAHMGRAAASAGTKAGLLSSAGGKAAAIVIAAGLAAGAIGGVSAAVIHHNNEKAKQEESYQEAALQPADGSTSEESDAAAREESSDTELTPVPTSSPTPTLTPSPTSTPTPEPMTADQAYQKELDKGNAEVYALQDIDGDGTEELFLAVSEELSSQFLGYHVSVYTFSGEEAVLVGEEIDAANIYVCTNNVADTGVTVEANIGSTYAEVLDMDSGMVFVSYREASLSGNALSWGEKELSGIAGSAASGRVQQCMTAFDWIPVTSAITGG